MKRAKPSLIRLAAAALVAALTLALVAYARAHPAWVSYTYKPFSRGFIRFAGTLFSVFPFSAAEFLLYGGIISVIAYIIVTIVRTVRTAPKWLPPLKCLSFLAVIAASMYLVFMGGWGLNYSALPLADELNLTVARYPTEALELTLREVIDELNNLTDMVPRDSGGNPEFGGFRDMADAARPSYTGATALRAKPVAASKLMSWARITGIFIPFTGEANVNADVPDSTIPFTAAHEYAHSMGVAPENEANFAAYLSCRESADPAVRYSGYLAAFTYLYNAYAGETSDAFMLYGMLSERVTRDFTQRREYWDDFSGKPIESDTQIQIMLKQAGAALGEAATEINDEYIQAMGIPDGVKSYGMVVDLILADFAARHGDLSY